MSNYDVEIPISEIEAQETRKRIIRARYSLIDNLPRIIDVFGPVFADDMIALAASSRAVDPKLVAAVDYWAAAKRGGHTEPELAGELDIQYTLALEAVARQAGANVAGVEGYAHMEATE